MEAQQGLKGVSESELHIENSDGWRFDWMGDGQQYTSSYGGTAQAAGGGDAIATHVVSIEEEDPMEVQFVFRPAMFLLYHSEGCNICGGLFRK
jgi:hypothetical protein